MPLARASERPAIDLKMFGLCDGAHLSSTPQVPCVQASTGRTDRAGLAGAITIPVLEIGWWGLWLAAVLTLVTGWDYLQAGLRHMLEPPRPADPAVKGAERA
mgnify:CR=1 FL=1